MEKERGVVKVIAVGESTGEGETDREKDVVTGGVAQVGERGRTPVEDKEADSLAKSATGNGEALYDGDAGGQGGRLSGEKVGRAGGNMICKTGQRAWQF